MRDCASGNEPRKLPGMARPTEFPDDIFVRMPPETKRRLRRLAEADPVPAVWLRQFLLKAIVAEEELRGLPPIEEAADE
jgi:hypothetical protein